MEVGFQQSGELRGVQGALRPVVDAGPNSITPPGFFSAHSLLPLATRRTRRTTYLSLRLLSGVPQTLSSRCAALQAPPRCTAAGQGVPKGTSMRATQECCHAPPLASAMPALQSCGADEHAVSRMGHQEAPQGDMDGRLAEALALLSKPSHTTRRCTPSHSSTVQQPLPGRHIPRAHLAAG
jgi:hypothetical protein